MVKSKLILQLQIRDQMSSSKKDNRRIFRSRNSFSLNMHSMKNKNSALRTVTHTYPDVLICIKKYDCPSNPRTSYLLCVFYSLGPGTRTVVERCGSPWASTLIYLH